jgi:hypothetical protein
MTTQNEVLEVSGPVPYEVRLEARIKRQIALEPGITPTTLKTRLGYAVPEAAFELVLDRLVGEGIVKREVKKVGLTLVEGL